jgi:hypothetical protein
MFSRDAICRTCGRLSFVSGCSATTGLAMVTDVSVVIRYALVRIHPRQSGCHRSPWTAQSVLNQGLRVMALAFRFSRRILLFSRVLVDLFVEPGPAVLFEVTGVPTLPHTGPPFLRRSAGGGRVPFGVRVTFFGLADGAAGTFAASTLKAWLRALLSNQSPPIRRCCFSSLPLTSPMSAWATFLWMKYAGNRHGFGVPAARQLLKTYAVTGRSGGSWLLSCALSATASCWSP